MDDERESNKYSTLIDVALKKCFERVAETLKDSLIEVMITVKDILAEAIQCEIRAFKSEQLIEVKKCKGKKANGSKRQARVSNVNSKKQTKGLLKSDSEATTEENSVTRDLVPPLEDTQPVVFMIPILLWRSMIL
ncbi:hypothetical protein ACOME3_000266 [Neoechinorhynchus agilis]